MSVHVSSQVGREYCYLRQHPLPEASAQKEAAMRLRGSQLLRSKSHSDCTSCKGVMQQLLAILRQSQVQCGIWEGRGGIAWSFSPRHWGCPPVVLAQP